MDIRRRKIARLRYEGAQTPRGASDSEPAPWRVSLRDRPGGPEEEVRSVRAHLKLSAVEKRRIAALGGAYVCSKLVDGALSDARGLFRDVDDTISQLSQACEDGTEGWRNRRARFNRTVRMLLEAGKCRTRLSRLREYYEQASTVAREASAHAAQLGRDDAAAAALAPWARDLANVCRSDLRRLHQLEGLLHSYSPRR